MSKWMISKSSVVPKCGLGHLHDLGWSSLWIFVNIVNDWKLLTIVTESFIISRTVVLDPSQSIFLTMNNIAGGLGVLWWQRWGLIILFVLCGRTCSRRIMVLCYCQREMIRFLVGLLLVHFKLTSCKYDRTSKDTITQRCLV